MKTTEQLAEWLWRDWLKNNRSGSQVDKLEWVKLTEFYKDVYRKKAKELKGFLNDK